MKKMYQLILIAFFVSLVLPSVALASWWNPFSWNIWGVFSSSNETSHLQPEPKNPLTKSEIEKSINSDTTFCNGSYWNKCSNGMILICPTTGDAYCDTPKTPKILQTSTKANSTPASQPVKTISTPISPVIQAVSNDCNLVNNYFAKHKSINSDITTGIRVATQGASLVQPPSSSQALVSLQSAINYFNSARSATSDMIVPQGLSFSSGLSSIKDGMGLELDALSQSVIFFEKAASDGEDGYVSPEGIDFTIKGRDLIQKALSLDNSTKVFMEEVAKQVTPWLQANCM